MAQNRKLTFKGAAFSVGYIFAMVMIFGVISAITIFPAIVLLAKVYWTEIQFIFNLW
jgi:hypothetical protein